MFDMFEIYVIFDSMIVSLEFKMDGSGLIPFIAFDVSNDMIANVP